MEYQKRDYIIKTNVRWWRVINICLITLGILTPWIRIHFDIQVVNQIAQATSGWKFLIAMWSDVIQCLITYGFEITLIPLWLLSLSGVLLIIYLLFDIFSLIKTKNPKSNKTISIILIGIVIALSLPIFIGGEPLIGFWLINIGLLSSAILEWRKWIDSITV
jgi:hypothetical protein